VKVFFFPSFSDFVSTLLESTPMHTRNSRVFLNSGNELFFAPPPFWKSRLRRLRRCPEMVVPLKVFPSFSVEGFVPDGHRFFPHAEDLGTPTDARSALLSRFPGSPGSVFELMASRKLVKSLFEQISM